ncbi:MAG TPA: hypothetical protein VFS43_14665 [Polyangiaceae bacterium]|nr:hypothetical protein [Polyangiaceae bacterium]
MSRTPVDVPPATSNLSTHRPPTQAFRPTKKPRTSLSAALAPKKGAAGTPTKGATPPGAPQAPKAPRRRAARAPAKGASPARRAPAAAPGSGGDGGEGDGGDGDPDEGGPSDGNLGDGDGDGTSPGEGDSGDGASPGERDPGDGASPGEGAAALVLAAAGSEGAASYARVRPEIEALSRDEVRHLSVNVPIAASIALGALPRLLAMRDAIVALPGQSPDALDKLRDYALAVAYAHALTLPRDDDETRLRALLAEALPLRERLLRGAEALAQFDLVDATLVASIRRGTGYVDAAQDLTALGALFRDVWPSVASKTPIQRAEVDRGAELGALVLEALGQRRLGTDGSADPREAEERLAKAYELFVRAYNECRQAVLYLRRREGDADLIAPPLGHSRRRPRRLPADEPEAPAEPADGEAEPGGGEADGG